MVYCKKIVKKDSARTKPLQIELCRFNLDILFSKKLLSFSSFNLTAKMVPCDPLILAEFQIWFDVIITYL